MDTQGFVTHLESLLSQVLSDIERDILNNTSNIGDAGFHRLLGRQDAYKGLLPDKDGKGGIQGEYQKYLNTSVQD